ncbi:MAG TPA: ATP-binding protein [Anaerolineae bacterium]|nr:ATP-binding protein [Anaerolineae bacterium]
MTWFTLQLIIIQAVFFLIALLVFINYLRYRDRSRADIALMFAAMGLPFIFTLIGRGNPNAIWPHQASILILATQPFLFLRLVQHFRSISTLVNICAIIGLILVWIGQLTSLNNLISLFGLLLLLTVETYAAWALIRAARHTAGVTQWRLRLVALAAALVATAVLVGGYALTTDNPNLPTPWTHFLLLPIGLTSAACYYLGFNPPRYLRQVWQQSELLDFFTQTITMSTSGQPVNMFDQLGRWALRTVGGQRALFAYWDQPSRTFTIDDRDISQTFPLNDSSAIRHVWIEQRPTTIVNPAVLGPALKKLTQQWETATVMLVPVSAEEENLGILLVFFNSPPLFGDDDLNSLRLLAQQSALMYTNQKMLWREQIARQHAETLLHTAAHLNAQHELHEALDVLCQETARALGVPIVTVSLVDDKQDALILAVDHGLPASVRDSIQPIPRELFSQFVDYEKPLNIVPNIQDIPDLPNRDLYIEADIRTNVHTTINYNKEFVGRLNIATIGFEREFKTDELTLLQGLAGQAGLAIQNARLFGQIQENIELLEQRVAERTRDLLIRNKELDAFAHTVAHDLKSPIQNMMSATTFIEYGLDNLSPEQQEALAIANRSSQQMQRIIQSLLLMATVQDTEMTLDIVDMSYLVEEVQQRLLYLVNEKEATFEMPDQWPPVWGYAPWIEEIWANYISNAIKYGGKPPHIRLSAEPVGHNMIRFSVHDNGPGLSDEQARILFQPFTQLESNVERGGHGLGLSIVQRIATRLGGEVGVSSEIGVGSNFWFTLRTANPEEEAPTIIKLSQELSAELAQDLS